MLSVYLDCPFLIAPSVSSNVYLHNVLFFFRITSLIEDINFMNTIHVHGSVYAIQQYVTKYVSDLWHVDGPLQVLRFALPTKMTSEILLKYCLKKHFVISHQTKTYFRLKIMRMTFDNVYHMRLYIS